MFYTKQGTDLMAFAYNIQIFEVLVVFFANTHNIKLHFVFFINLVYTERKIVIINTWNKNSIHLFEPAALRIFPSFSFQTNIGSD